MATTIEDYVSFEIAKLLREKGFNEPCFAYYDLFHDNAGVTLKLYKKFPRNPLNKQYLNVPTLQAAMKWLREVHNIHIELNPICYGNTEEDIKWHYGWAVKTTIFIDRWKRHNAEHISYEQAAEAAIKYCLENLI